MMAYTEVMAGDPYVNDGQNETLYRINDFKTKIPWLRPKDFFYELDVGLNADPEGRYIMAMGFIDQDKFNDIVTVDQDRSSFQASVFDLD